jgi:hypothetical protein
MFVVGKTQTRESTNIMNLPSLWLQAHKIKEKEFFTYEKKVMIIVELHRTWAYEAKRREIMKWCDTPLDFNGIYHLINVSENLLFFLFINFAGSVLWQGDDMHSWWVAFQFDVQCTCKSIQHKWRGRIFGANWITNSRRWANE